MANDEGFRYKFGTPMPGLDSKVTTALQDNFRRAATQKYVATQSGLMIPKSIGTAKGATIAFSAAGTPVEVPAAPGNGYVKTSDDSQPGGVGWASWAAVRVLPTAAQSINASIWTKVALDTNSSPAATGLTFDNANDRVYPNEAGLYAMQACVGFNTTASGQTIGSRIYINGNQTDGLGLMVPAGAVGIPVHSAIKIVGLSTTDYVEMWAFQNIANPRAIITSDGSFTALRIWRVR